LSRTTQVSRYQKGKTNLDFTEARDSECQWHQPDHMQVCIMLQTDNHASTPPLSFLHAGCPPFLPPNQQRQSNEGITLKTKTHSANVPSGRPPLLSARPAVTLATLLPVLLLGEQRHDGCEQFALDCYPTASRLRFEPRCFCSCI